MRTLGKNIKVDKAAPLTVGGMKDGEIRTTPDGFYARVGNQVLSKSLDTAIQILGAPWTSAGQVEVAGSGRYMQVTALLDGNFMLMYGKGSDPWPLFVSVYDSGGVIVGSETQIANNALSDGLGQITTLTNGNVVVTFADDEANRKPKFVILSPTGSIVKAATEIHPVSVTPTGVPVIPLETGEFMILYSEVAVYDELQPVIYNAAGTEISKPSPVSIPGTMYMSYYDTSPIPGGGVLVFFLDNNVYDIGYMVLSDAGILTHLEVDITGLAQDHPNCVALNNGNYFFAWYDDEVSSFNTYAIYSSNNEVVKAVAPTPLSYTSLSGGIIQLSNGNVMVHQQYLNWWFGEIFQEDGTLVEAELFGTIDGSVPSGAFSYCAQLTGGKIVAISNKSNSDSEFELLTGTTILPEGFVFDTEFHSKNHSLSNNNLTITDVRGGNINNVIARVNESKSSGKWYCEFHYTFSKNETVTWGVIEPEHNLEASSWPGDTALSYGIYANDGMIYNDGNGFAYGSQFTTDDIVMLALDMDNGKIYWGLNGAWFDSGDPENETNPAFTGLSGEKYVAVGSMDVQMIITMNFGPTGFTYTPPVGFLPFNQ